MMNNTGFDAAAWVKSLKEGDKVIRSSFGLCPSLEVLTVTKVTPSGIVRTTNGSYKFDGYKTVEQYGKCYTAHGKIIPVSQELLLEVATQEKKKEEEYRKKSVIREAQSLCKEVYCSYRIMSYEQAEQIVKILKDSKLRVL